jgi:hypothetical protein
MAVTHAIGFARDLNLNCPTETSTLMHLSIPVFAALERSAPPVCQARDLHPQLIYRKYAHREPCIS